ncbi:aminotransferase class IV [Aquabacter sp. L1I39]|uniref:aminotransferase class IV n=1 Tax=Aquabacter sp. L1I39 TaxID=2820278 RepID=UPI001ADC4176|nr:aminotransferase class IV [Aquabacter sp. L1I39]QTL02547.1 aminotransferase class IV [Aquabacter sp. L1I39]
MKIWLNGSVVQAAVTGISPQDRGFTLGDGLFETMKVVQGHIMRLEGHLARLEEGARVLRMPLPWSRDALEAAIRAVIEANALTDAVARLTVTRGTGPRGILPPTDPHLTLLVSAAPQPGPLPPARLCVAQTTRRNEHSPLARIKSLNYLDNIIARQEAAERGYDDALLLNTQGQIAEGTYANLFAIIDGHLVTPPVSDGALPGILRRDVLAAGGREMTLTPEALARAEEAFLTSSLGIRSLQSIEDRPLPSCTMAERLKEALR